MENLFRYLHTIVEPTVRDFEEHPASVRHAFLACVATFHAIDHLAFPKNARGLRQRFRKDSPDFAIVDDVAHALKHVTTRNRKGKPNLKVQQVISRPPARAGVMMCGLSLVGDVDGAVILATDVNVNVLGVVKRTVEFLRKLEKQNLESISTDLPRGCEIS